MELELGLQFKDPRLLQQALFHRSYVNEQGWSASDSYERLEFLGDAVLELIVSAELYRRLPMVSEGELTKCRSALVCQEALARLASRLRLGDFLLLGRPLEFLTYPLVVILVGITALAAGYSTKMQGMRLTRFTLFRNHEWDNSRLVMVLIGLAVVSVRASTFY